MILHDSALWGFKVLHVQGKNSLEYLFPNFFVLYFLFCFMLYINMLYTLYFYFLLFYCALCLLSSTYDFFIF